MKTVTIKNEQGQTVEMRAEKAAKGYRFHSETGHTGEDSHAAFKALCERDDHEKAPQKGWRDRDEISMEQREAIRRREAQNFNILKSKNLMNDDEQFSLSRLIRQVGTHEGIDSRDHAWAEQGKTEAAQSGIRANGFMIPREAFEKRDLTATGGTGGDQGGMTIATNKGNLLDSLFDNLFAVRAGATVYRGLTGNFDLPRIVAGSDPAHKTENAQADEYSPTTDQLSLSPNRLACVIEISNQLLHQSAERALEQTVIRHLRMKIQNVMEKVFINGVGGTEPTGILGTSGIGSVVGGTDGAAPTLEHLTNLVREVAVDNAIDGSAGFAINSATASKLKRTAKINSTDSLTLLDDRAPDRLAGYRYFESNAIPSNLDKGSSTGVCSAIIFGSWVDLVIAQWSGIEILVNPYSKDSEGITRINAAVFYDSGVLRPESFAAMQDALTA